MFFSKIESYQTQYNKYNTGLEPASLGLASKLAGEIKDTRDIAIQENDQKSRAALQELLTKVNALKQRLSSAIRPRAATSTPPITPSTAPSITSPVTPPTPTTGGDFSDLQRRMDALKTRVVIYADRRDKAGLQNHPIHLNLIEYARDRLVTMETSIKQRTNYGEVQEFVMESDRLLSAAEADINERAAASQQRQRSSTSSTPSSETPTTAPTTPPTPTTSTVQTARASIIQATKQPRMPNPSPEDQGAAFSYIVPGGQMPKLRPVARAPVAQPPVAPPTQAPLSAPPLQTAPAQPTVVRTETMFDNTFGHSHAGGHGHCISDRYEIRKEIQIKHYSDGSTQREGKYVIYNAGITYQTRSGETMQTLFPRQTFDKVNECYRWYNSILSAECDRIRKSGVSPEWDEKGGCPIS